MKFKVSIPTHNAANYLDLCLYSLKKHSIYDHDYLVILDDCKDHTLDVCKKHNVEYYEVNFHNPYLTRNCGLQQTLNKDDDSYLFMTADDMFASPEWDKKIYAHLMNQNDVVWSSQLTDYLLDNTFEIEQKEDPNLTIEAYADWWAQQGINMDFKECGQTAATFNEEVFLYKYKKLASPDEYYNSGNDGIKDVLCNTNFLIHNSFWQELSGWPELDIELEDARLGNNDVVFQNNIIEAGGRNIVPKDVLFFHFGGRTINRGVVS